MDLKALSDGQLSEHLNAVLAEQERRRDLAQIPEPVRELTERYAAGGGQIEDLEPDQAVTE